MKTLNLMLICIACVTFCECSNERNEITDPEQKKELAHPVRISTRADGSELIKIGLYMVYGEMLSIDNYINNISLTNDGNGNWSPDKTIYWKDNSSNADFIGYAPYDGSVDNAFAYTFSVQTDQSTSRSFESSDFLWGKAASQEPTDKGVDFTLNHIMSRIMVKVAAGDGFSQDELKRGSLSVKLNGFCTKTVINLGDGKLSNTSTVSVIKPYRVSDLQFDAIVIPQSVGNTGIVTVSFNDNDYILTRGITVDAGKRYTLSVTLSKTQSGINVGIGDWVDDGEDYGGTVK